MGAFSLNYPSFDSHLYIGCTVPLAFKDSATCTKDKIDNHSQKKDVSMKEEIKRIITFHFHWGLKHRDSKNYMQSPRKSVPLWWNRFTLPLAKQSNICVSSWDCHSPKATSREVPSLYFALGLFFYFIFSYVLLVVWALEELLVRGHLFCQISFLKLAGTGKLKASSLILLWFYLSSNAYWISPLKPNLPNIGISRNLHVFRGFCIRPHIFSPSLLAVRH